MKVKYTVTFYLDESQVGRLEKLREAYEKQGLNTTPKGLFESLMTQGSTFDIDEKLAYAEYVAGLRRHGQTAAEAHQETSARLKKEKEEK